MCSNQVRGILTKCLFQDRLAALLMNKIKGIEK